MLKDSRKITALVCLALLVVIAVFTWAIFRSNRLEASAQEMAVQVVEESFSEHYPRLLIENSHPDYQAETPVELLVSYVNGIKGQTGPLESLESIRGNAEIPLISFGQSDYFASYELKLIFRNTPAAVQIDMQFTEGRWQVTRLEAIADALIY
ncbi:MAG: hypothetical protein O3C29_09220 [Proteobacteria bacterium]|nr:hypothetical protein [Pseudomonadota bacterium]MDA1289925.1 hypothetical protein [Pseudomonadota bacterium]